MNEPVAPTTAAPEALAKSDQNLIWLDCEMTGLDPENVVEAIRDAVRSVGPDGRTDVVLPADYAIGNCSQRAVRFILSTHRRHEAWSGLRAPDRPGGRSG